MFWRSDTSNMVVHQQQLEAQPLPNQTLPGRRMLDRNSYRIGWICPLQDEEVAALEMLDEEHQRLPRVGGDTNIYNLGSINGHNIVIAGLPRAGNCSAASTLAQMRLAFPEIQYCLLVGTGGGVPIETESGMIRLGHVVVGDPDEGQFGACIQYDHGNLTDGKFERKGTLKPPPLDVMNAVRELAVHRERVEPDPVWMNIKRIKSDRRALRHFKYPGVENDHLYRSNYQHQNAGQLCEDGCDMKQRIIRPGEEEEDSFIVVHRGTIASGELVIQDATMRDGLAKEYGVICFEMEAAGVSMDFPCLVVRGISNYCDSHKNDVWRGYAAAAAAAYTRQLLYHLPVPEEHGANPTPVTFNVAMNVVSPIAGIDRSVGRNDEVGRPPCQEVRERNRRFSSAILCGLCGIGKPRRR